jgi:hypothetical protein
LWGTKAWRQSLARAAAEAHLQALPDHERDDLLERAATETGRRLDAAAVALLAAVDAVRLPVDVTPEMVAVAPLRSLVTGSRPTEEGDAYGLTKRRSTTHHWV